jgi:hypothetical protein
VAGAAIAAEMWEIGAGKSAAQHRSAERAHRDELRRAS